MCSKPASHTDARLRPAGQQPAGFAQKDNLDRGNLMGPKAFATSSPKSSPPQKREVTKLAGLVPHLRTMAPAFPPRSNKKYRRCDQRDLTANEASSLKK